MNHVKENLRYYLPSIVEFIGEQEFPWTKVNARFNKKIEKRIEEATGETFTVEASIYDIIIACKKGLKDYEGLLFFFNSLFEELIKNTEDNTRAVIKTTVWNLLISFDSKYLNYIGELAVLNNLLKSKTVELIKCEVSLDNKKSIDFDVIFPENGMRVLIEVVNIHLDPQKTEDDPNKIKTFLEKRLNDKRKSKTGDSEYADKVHLIPVLWGSHENLRIYERFFKTNKIDTTLTYEPMAYLTYTDSNGYFETYFNPITKLFKE
ncbi:hypothetical protein [Winogradskyella sp. PG-2]|uniref:hypothetical protein n=1 Tax=Winogradskyella sp. PG-2 TaxID=754409 RepID=UPI000458859E|nr:hypothetical protein [Winogradskyella sp. PG-2]BAO76449.1 hypothetical protein WPG_2219 [Winogradskyella sp. PG-2]